MFRSRNNLCHLFCIAALLTFGFLARAQTPSFNTESELIAYTEELRLDKSINPIESEHIATQLITVSQNASWGRANLYAKSMKIEALSLQENVKAANDMYKQVYPLALQMGDETIITRLTIIRLSIIHATNDLSSIDQLHSELLARVNKLNDSSKAADIYTALGNSEFDRFELGEAIKYYQLAFNIYEKNSYKQGVAVVLGLLATAYEEIGDLDTAIELHNKSLNVPVEHEDKFSISITLFNIASAYLKKGDIQSAKNYLEQSLQVSLEIDDDIGIAWVKSTLVQIALNKEAWDEAIKLAQQANITFVETGDLRSQINNELNLAEAYIGKGEVNLADSILTRLKPLLDQDHPKNSQLQYNSLVSQIAIQRKDHEQAYLYLERNFDLLSDIFKNNKTLDAQRYKVEFAIQLQANENQILQKENEVNQLKILAQKRQNRIWILVIALSLIFSIVVVALLIIQTKNRDRFKDMAMKDHLTKSPNRRAILEYATTCFEQAKVSNMDLSIAIIDLDSFKKLNDDFGHDVGDQVLKYFADSCFDVLRKQDGFGRYGGEEWLLVFSDTKESEIQIIFNRLRECLNEKILKIFNDGEKITFSMGVAQYDKNKDTKLRTLIKRADQNLYLAKDLGRNRVIM